MATPKSACRSCDSGAYRCNACKGSRRARSARVERHAEAPEEYCGGEGSNRPGPCPRGRGAAHATMRAHANAAAARAQRTGKKLAQAEQVHGNRKPGTKGHARLEAARKAHEQAQGKADRLHKKARALEHQHGVGQWLKAQAKAKRQEREAKRPQKPAPKEKPPVKHPAGKPASKRPSVKSQPKEPERPAADSKPPSEPALRSTLADKYKYLTKMVEFQDGLVSLPRLYDQARKEHPGLTVEQFHHELESLEKEKKVQLHVENDPRRADRPELGIRKPEKAGDPRSGALLHWVAFSKSPGGDGGDRGAAKTASTIKALRERTLDRPVPQSEIEDALHGLQTADISHVQAAAKAIDVPSNTTHRPTLLKRIRHKLNEGDAARESIAVSESGTNYERISTHAEAFAELDPTGDGKTYRLRNVELFPKGNPRGKPYTRADLDDICRNFACFSTPDRKCGGGRCVIRPPVLIVPGVKGHEEEQKTMQRTDLPAGGWVTALRHDGKMLHGDIEGVSKEYAQDIADGRFRTLSVEINPILPHGCPEARAEILRLLRKDKGIDPAKALPWATKHAVAEQAEQYRQVAKGTREYVEDFGYIVDAWLRAPLGRSLRRVAYLGATPPEVKTIAELPTPEPEKHSEQNRTFAFSRRRALRFSRFNRSREREIVFSEVNEVRPMDREAMLKKLSEMGVNCQGVTDAVPDEVLQEWLRSLDDAQQSPEDEPDEEQFDDEPDMEAEEEPEKDRGEENNDADDYEEEPEEIEEGKPKKMGERCGGSSMKYSERQVKAMVKRAVDQGVSKAIKQIKRASVMSRRETEKFAEERRAADKKLAVEKFCESMQTEGRLLKRDLDPQNPKSVFNRLLRADARRVVQKFSENGKTVEATEFDLQCQEIRERLPVIQYGEKLRDPAEQQTNEDRETRKVEQHYDRYAEVFKKQGMTRDVLVKGFKAACKNNEGLTAEQFLKV